MMWYSDDEVIAIIAGMAYENSKLPMLSVPSDNVVDLLILHYRSDDVVTKPLDLDLHALTLCQTRFELLATIITS